MTPDEIEKAAPLLGWVRCEALIRIPHVEWLNAEGVGMDSHDGTVLTDSGWRDIVLALWEEEIEGHVCVESLGVNMLAGDADNIIFATPGKPTDSELMAALIAVKGEDDA